MKNHNGDQAAVANRAGLALFQAGDLESALKKFEEAARQDPASAEYSNNMGICHLHRGRVAPAVELFERAIHLKSDIALYHFNLGLGRMQVGDRARARESFERATELKPDYFDALAQLGTLYYSEKKFDRARDVWARALSQRDAPELAGRLGAVLMEMGQDQEAERMLLGAIAKQNDLALPLFNLGVLYQRRKKYSEAETYFRRAIKVSPENFAPYYNLGLVLKASGDKAGAIAAFENFHKLAPGSMERQKQDARAQIEGLKNSP